MELLNASLGALLDVMARPLRPMPPAAGLAAAALASAILMLLVVKRTSDGRRIAAVKRQIRAAIYEIRLFNDDLRVILRAQGEILRQNGTYLRLSMVPMLWLVVPFAVLVPQCHARYGYSGIRPGQAVLVKAQLRDGSSFVSGDPVRAARGAGAGDGSAAVLEAPPGIDVHTPAVWIPGTSEVIWRVSPRAGGEHEMRIRIGGQTYAKSLDASEGAVRRSPLRAERGFWNGLLYPAEPPLEPGPVRSIGITYPEYRMQFLGWDLHWMLVYFLLTMMFVLLLRRPMGVVL